jgi:RHS repeat-associated protein
VRRDGIEVSASVGDNDQLLAQGGVSFTYDAAGQLDRRTDGNAVTDYDYDLLGNLRGVSLPDGRKITYVIDGFNRRIGKRVNGVLQRGYLHRPGGGVIAVVRDDGKTVIQRFIYASRSHVPDVMHANSRYYRLVTDAIGSVRLVVDTLNGQIVQELDYDSFGRVVRDTSPGFQPFGFAGGLYDADTGLVRFGARDYDPSTGRFTAPDPSSFGGGDTNLYAYVHSDPVDFVDPSGHIVQGVLLGGGIGLVGNVAGYAFASWASGCEMSAGGLFAAAASGFVGGVMTFYGVNGFLGGAFSNVLQTAIGDALNGSLSSADTYLTSIATGVLGAYIGGFDGNPLGSPTRIFAPVPGIAEAELEALNPAVAHLGRDAGDWVMNVAGGTIGNWPIQWGWDDDDDDE